MKPLSRTDFVPADKAAWLEQVKKELKDPAASESLRWNTGEGFVVDPYYTADDLVQEPLSPSLLQAGQQAQKRLPGWLNAPAYHLTDDAPADNATLRNALTQGADALVLTVSGPATGDASVQRSSRLLNGIKLSDTPVFFRLDAADAVAFVAVLKTVAPYQLKGGLLTDTGVAAAEATRLTADSPQFRTVCARSHVFHNAGATATQELAFTLATLADAYDELTDAGLTTDQLVPKTMFSVSVGTSYFMEIAKLRALRVLFSRFLAAYSQSAPAFVHAQTSTFYDARTTPYTNLLRATTEAMAAVIGGCDALTVHPYDTVLASQTDFSERIARNISVLMKEESYFDKVADPSAGSYYIEILTHQLSEAAWALFLNIEQRGGFAKAFESGFIQNEIERAYRAKVEAVQQGRILVGVTKFRHDEESTSKPVSRSGPGLQAGRSKEDLAGLGNLPNQRLTEDFE